MIRQIEREKRTYQYQKFKVNQNIKTTPPSSVSHPMLLYLLFFILCVFYLYLLNLISHHFISTLIYIEQRYDGILFDFFIFIIVSRSDQLISVLLFFFCFCLREIKTYLFASLLSTQDLFSPIRFGLIWCRSVQVVLFVSCDRHTSNHLQELRRLLCFFYFLPLTRVVNLD